MQLSFHTVTFCNVNHYMYANHIHVHIDIHVVVIIAENVKTSFQGNDYLVEVMY